ncbi:MAG TPA: type II secretion system protein [Fervidobacterium sp.]|nr:type II secretion system protein [Fervidobacterium sp.]
MKKGFTLVELLIVMAIIAALMAVATPTGINALAQAKATAVAANFRTLQQAVIQMLMLEKTPPTSGEILDYIYANGYVSTKPEGFSIYYVDSDKTYVIKYTNSDIDAVKVKNINNSVELDSSDGKMIIKIPKS